MSSMPLLMVSIRKMARVSSLTMVSTLVSEEAVVLLRRTMMKTFGTKMLLTREEPMLLPKLLLS